VAVQLRQNLDLMRAQIRHELAIGIVNLLNSPADDSQLGDLFRRGAAGDSLTADEQYQLNAMEYTSDPDWSKEPAAKQFTPRNIVHSWSTGAGRRRPTPA